MTPDRASFLPTLDGLRAVAIALVLLFHARLVPGGFIGVDVFFVLSGFVITRTIMRERESGSFSFIRFYLRRAARLLPALTVTIMMTLAAGAVLLGPAELERLSRSALWSALSGSNIFFWQNLGYFDPAAETWPLLHTWSLGVEVQFYLVWPALLILALSLGRRRAFMALAGIGALSFAATLLTHPHAPQAAFFLTPFRAFQFAAGGLLALGAMPRAGTGGDFAAVIAAGAMMALAAVCTESGPILAMAVTIAAAGFIANCEGRATRALFAFGPVRWVGKRAYSIYLVHWPLMVFWPAPAWATITVSLAGGAVLFWAVEDRFRVHRGWRLRFAVPAPAVAIVTANATLATAQHSGEETRQAFDREISAALDAIGRACIVYRPEEFDIEACAPARGERRYLILGDSWAGNSYLVFSAAYPEVTFDRFSAPGCSLRHPSSAAHSDACRALYTFALDELVSPDRYEGVILSSSWNDPYADIAALADELRQAGLRVILTGQYLVFAQSVPDALLRKDDPGAQPSRADMDRHLVDYVPGAELVRMIQYQCEGACAAADAEGRPLYMDTSHLTLAGASAIAARLRAVQPDLMEPPASK